jgi:hypothetical protein
MGLRRREVMDELKIIKYLLDEIEAEQNYNKSYEEAREKAEDECRQCGEYEWRYGKYMPSRFDRAPRQSVIKANAKKIRQLLLKLY